MDPSLIKKYINKNLRNHLKKKKTELGVERNLCDHEYTLSECLVFLWSRRAVTTGRFCICQTEHFKLLKLKFDMIIKLMIDGQLENIKRQLEALGFHSC